jgi:hypothetical protein
MEKVHAQGNLLLERKIKSFAHLGMLISILIYHSFIGELRARELLGSRHPHLSLSWELAPKLPSSLLKTRKIPY